MVEAARPAAPPGTGVSLFEVILIPHTANVARKIIELANGGERDPDLLGEQALASLSTPPPRV
jgi:hypothetical protein